MQESRYRRLRGRYGKVIWITSIIVLLCLFLLIAIIAWPQNSLKRKTIVVVGDPMRMVSRDEHTNRWVIITIPAGVTIEGANAYGSYSLASLWELGQIDKKKGSLLVTSLEDVTGIPLYWYISELNEKNQVFSLSTLTRLITGTIETNIPLHEFVRLIWAYKQTRADRIETVDLKDLSILMSESLPDGSTVETLRPERLDAALETLFEDQDIRSEGLRIAVFNATGRPQLGSHAARMINRIGGLVVSIGNEDTQIDQCILRAVKTQLGSKTAAILKAIFSCTNQELKEEGRADLDVILGSAYEERFLSPSGL